MTSPHSLADTIFSANRGGYSNYSTQNITVNSGVTVRDTSFGISNSGAVGTFSNNGTIGSSASAVYNTNLGSIGTFNNNGAIDGGVAGIYNGGGIIGVINNTGTINGSYGIYNTSAGTIGTLGNSGTISAIRNEGTIAGGATAIANTGTIGALTNTGTIGGVQGIWNDSNGTIGTLSNAGTISGTLLGIYNSGRVDMLSNSGTINGRDYGVANFGAMGTLDNSGSISGANHGGIMNTSMIDTLNNSGIVSSGLNGILNSGTINTLINSRAISGGTYGIYNSGTIGALSNSGTISGGNIDIFNLGTIGALSNSGTIGGNNGITNNNTIVTLDNSGTISGSNYALYNSSSGTLGVITNTGIIAGQIYNGSGNDLTIKGGTGATFGTLTGYSGGVGVITNTGSNLIFGSGNLLLNDNINVGTNTVSNLASSLQVNNHLTITGNYNQSSAAALLIGVADNATAAGSFSTDGGYGYLYVTGNTTIASGSAITLNKTGGSYAFAQGQRYVVVITAGTAAYNANSLIYSATGFSGTVTGTSVTDGGNTGLMLTLVGGGSSAPGNGGSSSSPVNFASTYNAVSALNGLFNYGGTNASLLNTFNAAAALGSTAAANSAGAQLSPIANVSSVTRSAAASSVEVINQVAAHVNDLRAAQASGASGVATGESPANLAFWGQAFGGRANQGQRDNVSGYHSNYKGLLLGADTLADEYWRLGGLLSYANTAVSNTGDNVGSSAHAESYGVMGYAGYTAERYYLDFSAGVTSHRYNTVRAIDFTGFSGTALGQFNGSQYVASVRGGYPIKIDAIIPDATLTPIAGLTYSNLRQNGYRETGGNGAALNVGAAGSTSLKSELGAKLERSFSSQYGEVVPSAQLGWRHEFHKNAQQLVSNYVNDTSGTTSFTTQGATANSDTGVVALALTLVRNKNLTVSARYTVEAASGYTGQTADVRLRYQF
ncbi:autotransporter outer membrane beta-barrel domain-containing protein [Herbaspirillum chlorophenolicum]|uniref:autotransporter outer membrane beta-barrel domain-containing protein n=3 Tax=Herbaspirillum chlorophenolicum TaxID=211589 RepID=UPI000774B6A8|nr:autotransporter domain-containing protein [Herbaspirillum chlorophenolicum]